MAANVRTGECDDATVSSLSRPLFRTGIRVARTVLSTRRFGGTTTRPVPWIRADRGARISSRSQTTIGRRLVVAARPISRIYRVKLSADAITGRRARRDIDCVPLRRLSPIATSGRIIATPTNVDANRDIVCKTRRYPSARTPVVAHLSVTACVTLFGEPFLAQR